MTLHSFTTGTPQNKVQTPLTMDEIAQRAPSALAVRPYDEMSKRYAFVPTINIIEGMMKSGFQPFSATQSLTRIAGKQPFAKHMLRFRHQDAAQSLVVGDVIPEVVLVNSHDGECTFRLSAGLYRLACSNGLLVAEAEIMSLVIRHTGHIMQDVIDGSYRLTENAGKTLATVQKWQQLQLTDGERSAFAQAAHTLRFADSDGKTTTPITPAQLLEPRRREDVGTDLWSTLNVVQENVIAGGLSAVQRNANGQRVRRVTTRRINGINEDVRLNKALWELASRMAELKGAPKVSEPKIIDAEFVEAA